MSLIFSILPYQQILGKYVICENDKCMQQVITYSIQQLTHLEGYKQIIRFLFRVIDCLLNVILQLRYFLDIWFTENIFRFILVNRNFISKNRILYVLYTCFEKYNIILVVWNYIFLITIIIKREYLTSYNKIHHMVMVLNFHSCKQYLPGIQSYQIRFQ